MTTGRSKGPRALPRAALPTGPAALLIADAEERAAIEPVLKTGGLALTTRLIDIREFDLENFLLDLEDAFEGPLARTAVVVVAADLLVDARIDIINLLDQILEPERPILVSCSQATATEQSALADHPERIVGFSMLPLLGGHRVIEVAGTARTDPAIVERVRALFQAGGLVARSVEDRPGLVLARILAPIVHEAANALDEGVASAEAIDDAMRLGAEWPFGPLRWADGVGLHRLLLVMEFLQRNYEDARYRPAPLIRRLALSGMVGKASGQGFYRYEPEPQPRPRPVR